MYFSALPIHILERCLYLIFAKSRNAWSQPIFLFLAILLQETHLNDFAKFRNGHKQRSFCVEICVMKYRLYVCVCPCVKADEQREKRNKILQCTGLVYKWGTNTNILKSTLQLHYFVVNMMHNNNIAREFGLAMWVSWLCWKADLVNYSDVPISISVYWITIYLAVP